MGKREAIMEYILSRHKEEIERTEAQSLSRLRQIVSPHSEYVIRLKTEILASLAPYIKEDHFLDAAQKMVSHCSRLEVIRLPVQFSLSFEEMEKFGAAPLLDKALLETSLLRAAGSEDAALVIGSAGTLVKFSWDREQFAVDVEKDRLLRGKEAEKYIAASKPLYVLNDLFFEFVKK